MTEHFGTTTGDTRPAAQTSYNDGLMDKACEAFLSANEAREKLTIARALVDLIPSHASVADLGGGNAVVAKNVLSLAQKEGKTLRHLTFVEPTDLLIRQAQQRLSDYENVTFVHDCFAIGIDTISDVSMDVIYESNALPNFGDNLSLVVSQIAQKLAKGGKFISILPRHDKGGYGTLNRWGFEKICETNSWYDTTNDYASLAQDATEQFASTHPGYTAEVSDLDSTFFYPMIDGDINKTIQYLLVFMFDLSWEDDKFNQLLQQTHEYLSENNMISAEGISMSLVFQVLTLQKNTN